MKAKTKLWRLVALLLGLSLLGVSCQTFASPYTFKGTLLDPPQPIPDFELLTTEGKPFHLSDKAGDITLVYFGYTFCPDVCPLTLADVKRALSELKEKQERVHVVFISVDPERDTPDVLSRYLAAFDPTFIGLTDDPAKLEAAKAAFGVFSEKEQTEDSAAGYLVSHTARLFLVNPQGELKLLYSFEFPYEDLQSDLEHLLAEL
jgi:protein SCO1/2